MPSTKKRTKDFTENERAVILARAKEVGIIAAADEFGTSWQAVAAWQRAERKESGEPAPQKEVKAKARGRRGTKGQLKGRKAVKADKSNAVSVATTKKPMNLKGTSLEFENALLREKINSLTEKVERLRAAVAQLA